MSYTQVDGNSGFVPYSDMSLVASRRCFSTIQKAPPYNLAKNYTPRKVLLNRKKGSLQYKRVKTVEMLFYRMSSIPILSIHWSF